jgi:hypothetical protein
LRLKSAGEPSQRASQQRHFPTGGVRSKKFEQISPKICRTGGIPPKPPFRPPHLSASGGEATLSDWTISSFSLAEIQSFNIYPFHFLFAKTIFF